jgi:hypothetical protein
MCILAVHHPQTFKGTENYWNSDPAGKGIYATFVRWIMNANGMSSNPDCSQYPFGRVRGTPYSAYTNYNLTERYGYAPIDMAETITNVINGTSEPNRKPLLTDFVTPAGINISWIGW